MFESSTNFLAFNKILNNKPKFKKKNMFLKCTISFENPSFGLDLRNSL